MTTRSGAAPPTAADVPSARTRPILFVVLAYGLSWAWAIPLAASGAVVEPGRGWPTHVPSLLGPMLAAVTVVGAHFGKCADEHGRLLSTFNRRGSAVTSRGLSVALG